MAYDREQQHIIDTINQIARQRRVPKHHLWAALEIGRVETNFHNLAGGDADSKGWRQERASLYKNPRNLHASINRVFDEMAKLDHGQTARELAADVQRPREDLRGRYGLYAAEARKLAGMTPNGDKTAMSPNGGTQPRIIPGGITTDAKAAMLAALMDKRKGMSLLDRYQSAIGSGGYTTVTPPTVTPGQQGSVIKGSAGNLNSSKLGRLQHRANVIDNQEQPYLWGGGHQGKTKLRNVVALDCSGAVSKLLGINPRVASQFKTWGKPGRGKNFTVWAADDHVLVEIGGHFWGTSGSNPGGGAGWIPASAISASYLKRFTPRHF